MGRAVAVSAVVIAVVAAIVFTVEIGRSRFSTGPIPTVTVPTGNISGVLEVPGVVAIQGQYGRAFTVRSDARGTFSVRVPIGWYELTETTPWAGPNPPLCLSRLWQVLAGQTTTATVNC